MIVIRFEELKFIKNILFRNLIQQKQFNFMHHKMPKDYFRLYGAFSLAK